MGLFDLPGHKREVTTRRKNVAHSKNGKPFVRKQHPLHFWKRTFAWNDRRRLRKEASLAHKAKVAELKTQRRESAVERKLANINLKGAKRTGLVQEASRLEAEKLRQMDTAREANTEVAKLQLARDRDVARLQLAAQVEAGKNNPLNIERERERELRAERIKQADESALLRDRDIEVRKRNVALREKMAGIEAKSEQRALRAPTLGAEIGEAVDRRAAELQSQGVAADDAHRFALSGMVHALNHGHQDFLNQAGRVERVDEHPSAFTVEYERPTSSKPRAKKPEEVVVEANPSKTAEVIAA